MPIETAGARRDHKRRQQEKALKENVETQEANELLILPTKTQIKGQTPHEGR